jgi:uncharacterized protein YjiS (DUF1127 family)
MVPIRRRSDRFEPRRRPHEEVNMSAHIDTKSVVLRRREPVPVFGGAITAIVARMHAWRDRACQRRALSQLDDRLLHDIGLTRYDVLSEAGKPFWLP